LTWRMLVRLQELAQQVAVVDRELRVLVLVAGELHEEADSLVLADRALGELVDPRREAGPLGIDQPEVGLDGVRIEVLAVQHAYDRRLLRLERPRQSVVADDPDRRQLRRRGKLRVVRRREQQVALDLVVRREDVVAAEAGEGPDALAVREGAGGLDLE